MKIYLTTYPIDIPIVKMATPKYGLSHFTNDKASIKIADINEPLKINFE